MKSLNFASKLGISFALVVVLYSGFVGAADPYTLLGDEDRGKSLPFTTWYHYNYIKKFESLDYGFCGSSAVNYFPIEQMYPDSNKLFSMGIESSNIHEHITYGKLVAEKQPKELVLFVTFYALNPARPNQTYFNERVIKANNLVVDFLYQYFNKQAFGFAWKYLTLPTASYRNWFRVFNFNGTRTQNERALDTNFDFRAELLKYLLWEYHDPRYYAAKTFEDPQSIEPGIEELREFKQYLEARNIRLRLVVPPIHRSCLTLIYLSGLGDTYEASRRELAQIAPFNDLNLDLEYTSKDKNFWDTHHVRNGKHVVDALRDDRFKVTLENVEQGAELARPSQAEIDALATWFQQNPFRQQAFLASDLRKNPARVP